MRTVITIILGMLVVLAGATLYMGCNRDADTLVAGSPQANEFTLDPGDSDPSNTPLKAQIIGADPDHTQRAVVLRLQMVGPDGLEIQRLFRMQVDEDQQGDVFLATSLTDTTGSTLWSLRYTIDHSDQTHTRSEISSPDHVVTCEQREYNGIRLETYSYDGDVHVFSLPLTDMDRAVQLYKEGLVDGSFDRSNLPERLPTDKQIISQIESIQRFFVAHDNLALDSNHQLGVQISKNPQVIQRVRAELNLPDGDPVTEKFWKKLCAAAGMCALITCTGWPGSPPCIGCGLVSAICLVIAWAMDYLS